MNIGIIWSILFQTYTLKKIQQSEQQLITIACLFKLEQIKLPFFLNEAENNDVHFKELKPDN